MASTSTTTPAANSTIGLTALDACCQPMHSGVADASARALAEMFKALADPARVKIMSMLLNADEVCACDISQGIGKSAATASHHLKILKESGLAVSERRGTWVYYRAVPQQVTAIRDALALGQ